MSVALISVVIPCFNQAHFLPDSIESVLDQTHDLKEIIVIDDGSTDDTAQVASRYPEVTLVSQSNSGLAAARNSGLKASRGEYLVFLDADDCLKPDALTAGLDCLAQHPECAFAYGRYTIRNLRGEVWEPQSAPDQRGDAYAKLLRGNHIAMHATVIYRRDTLELVGGFDTRLPACEDYDLYLRIARRFPIVEHESVVAEYRRHGHNMSVDSPKMLAAVLRVLEAQRDYVDENPIYKMAYTRGIRFWKRFYGVRSFGKIARELFAFRFADAIADTTSLVRTAGASTVLLNAPVWIVRHLISDRSQEWNR
jgi:glycosyltransferase involved in cell wall biosynthesis